MAGVLDVAVQSDNFCLFFQSGNWIFCHTKSEWAAWVQAIGSVAAIYFAAWGTRQQIKNSFAMKRSAVMENNRNMARTCFEIAGGIVSVSKSRNNFYIKGEKFSFERINDIQETLRILLSKEMPNELVKSIFAMQKILGVYKEKLLLINGINLSFDAQQKNEYVRMHKDVVNSVLHVRNDLKSYMVQMDIEILDRDIFKRSKIFL